MIGTQRNADFQDTIKQENFSAFIWANLRPCKEKEFYNFLKVRAVTPLA